jgi:ABC-2 type transport system permease protein
MKKSIVIFKRELLELRHQPGLLLSISLMPLLLTLLPLLIIKLVGSFPATFQQPLPFERMNPAWIAMSTLERQQTFIGQVFAAMLLLIPIIVPSIIASHSIIGEKLARTLEPVLATPVSTWELLLGKCLAAMFPAVVITWVCGGIFITGLAWVAVSRSVLQVVISPGWLIVLFLCTPLMVMIAVAAMVALSSRVNDPRTAQQISAVAIVPVLLIFFGQLAGLLILSPLLALSFVGVLAAIAALSLHLATRIFQREIILTRWN